METTVKSISPIFTSIPANTKKAFDLLSEKSWLKDQQWYLAGGTALALQAGHRVSLDLDFFTQRKDIDESLRLIQKDLASYWKTTYQVKDTLYGELHRAKISFIAYPFFVPKKPLWQYENVQILDIKDIAVMKIIAISQRGRKRDFFDLYWYLHNTNDSLLDVLNRVAVQYPDIDHSYHHLIRSLVYFDDAEEDPEPEIFFNASWMSVKEYFKAAILKIEKFFI